MVHEGHNGAACLSVTVRDVSTGANSERVEVTPDTLHDAAARLAGMMEGAVAVDVERELAVKLDAQDPNALGPILTRLSDVTPKPIDWLWPQKIARGKLTLWFGDPGGGKSTASIDLAARLSTGALAPDGTPLPGPASSLFITCEDGLADTIKPRATAAEGDTSKIIVFEGIRAPGANGAVVERFYTIGDIGHLRDAILSEPDTALVVIDPASAYLGDSDSHKNDQVRALLAPLGKLAEETNVAIILITHMSKSGGGRAIYRAMGSLAFIAAARSAWLIAKDKENPARRLFLPVKNNIGNDQIGHAYSLVDRDGVAVLEWEAAPITTSVDEAIRESEDQGKPGPAPEEREAAKEWLTGVLANGEVEVKQLKKEAIAAGVAWRTLQRAKTDLKVRSHRSTYNPKAWVWRMPKPTVSEPESKSAK